MSYQIGDRVRFTATFRDGGSRALVNPDTVRFRYRKPDGTEHALVYGTDAELVQESGGVFHVDLLLTMASTTTDDWSYRWEAEGNLACAIEKTVQVDDTQFTSVPQT